MIDKQYKWRGIYIRPRRAKKRIILDDIQETLVKIDKCFRHLNTDFVGHVFEEIFIPA